MRVYVKINYDHVPEKLEFDITILSRIHPRDTLSRPELAGSELQGHCSQDTLPEEEVEEHEQAADRLERR